MVRTPESLTNKTPGIIKRESMKEQKNSKADNLLQQNISRWHTSYQRATNTSPGGEINLLLFKIVIIWAFTFAAHHNYVL